ncbi:MAG: diguanylate cyclase [Calothrix sp. MO_167.B42]|nr:diguanylate cyclase [Calothrix sp. MO_167.B42]
MTIEETLKFIDSSLQNKTGKQLTTLETEIILAAWENRTYNNVADKLYLSVGYIKDMASKLWQFLSEILDEKITKTNLRRLLEKYNIADITYSLPNNIEDVSNLNLNLKEYTLQLQQEIEELRQTKEILYQSRAFLTSVLNSSVDGIAAMQTVRNTSTGEIIDFRFLVANPVISQIFSSTKEELIDKLLLKSLIDKISSTLFNSLVQVVETGEAFNQELYYEDSQIQKWYHIIAVKLGDGISLTIRDISKCKLVELELIRQSRVDALTNIPNRRCFDEYLNQEWQRYKREQKPISLILCDIDNFSYYNYFYSHQIGDNCLIKIAQAINNCAKRAVDLVARYGGDEFAVILPNTDANGALHMEELIRSQIANLKIPHEQSQAGQHITVSSGIATMIPTGNTNVESLMMAADKALYQAKKQRDNCIVVFYG